MALIDLKLDSDDNDNVTAVGHKEEFPNSMEKGFVLSLSVCMSIYNT